MEFIVKKELTEIFSRLGEWVAQSERPLVITHLNPDGDAIGSLLGLYLYLKTSGKKAHGMTPNNFPDFLRWLPSAGEIVRYQGHEKRARQILQEADLLIMVDFNDPKRLGRLGREVTASPARKAIIDHHPSPALDAGLIAVQEGMSSAAELVFSFIEQTSGQEAITQEIAECIFTGIMTDTGCFSFNSSHPETFRTVSRLLETGIDKDRIFDKVYNNFSVRRMQLLGYALYRKMKVLPEYHSAYMVLTLDEQKEFGFLTGDSEGFVNYPLSVRGVIFSVLVMEKADHVKLSFRSKGKFDVNEFARKYFSGGGHVNAAGGESNETLEKTVHLLEKTISNSAHELEEAYRHI